MQLSDLIGPDGVMPVLEAATKKQLLHIMSAHAAGATGLAETDILDVLLQRERLGATGMGAGVAVPHGKVQGLDGMRGFFARLRDPVDFGAIDDQPVDLVFLLLVPAAGRCDHLEALACISRRLRQPAVCRMLRQATGPDALLAALTRPVLPAADAA